MKKTLKNISRTRLGMTGVAVFAVSLAAGFSQSITWQGPTTVFTAATLDAIPGLYSGATLVQSVDFGNSSVLTVTTPGGQTIPFAAGSVPFNAAPSGTGTMLAYSGTQTLTPAPGTGNATFDTVLQNDGWAAGNGPTLPQTIQIGGLTSGTTYAIDLFTYDPRSSSAGRSQEYADTVGATGNNSASFTYATPESVIGTFTASSSIEDVYVWDTIAGAGAGHWDTAVSAFTLYSVPEPGTCALLAGSMGMLLLRFRNRRRV